MCSNEIVLIFMLEQFIVRAYGIMQCTVRKVFMCVRNSFFLHRAVVKKRVCLNLCCSCLFKNAFSISVQVTTG